MRTLLIGMLILAGATAAQAIAGEKDAILHPRVTLQTSLGEIVLELNGEKAPISVENFMRYAQAGFYDGLIFHRVVSTFMIQGGGFTTEMDERSEGLRPPIKNEWRNGLKNQRGTIAMARTNAPNSATAQFFINVVDNDRLDQPISGNAGYAVFGKVVEGMDVVDRIRDVDLTEHPKLPMGRVVPAEAVIIQKAATDSSWNPQAFRAAWDKIARAKWPEPVQEWVRKAESEQGRPITADPIGVSWFVLKEGEGDPPGPTSQVMTHYTGRFLSGEQFDSSIGSRPYQVKMVGGVIQGWLDTLATMRAGEKRLVLIPPHLAYGSRGQPPTIPPDTWLTFEMEVMEIQR